MIFDGDRDALGTYVREIADLMGLRDWRISVDPKPCDDQDGAEIECVYGQKRGIIQFHRDWATWTPERLREVALHEVIHCHLDAIRLPIQNIRSVLGQPLYDTTYEAHRDFVEYATDALANAIADYYPLPVKVDEEAA